MSNTHVVRVGVFMPAGSQLIDMSCVDVLHIMSREYLSIIPIIPAHVADLAPSVRISYITSKANMAAGHIPLTAGATLLPTHDTEDPAVGPGSLDVLIVPGADPAEKFDEEVQAWLRGQMATEGTDVLSVCTGIYLCGQAGILEGRKACGPRGMQDDLKKRWPDVEFVGESLRWTRDGRFWSCGGISNGLDLAAEYARQSDHFPSAIAELGAKMAEVGERPQRYDQGSTTFALGFVWQIIRAWFSSPKTKSKSS